MKPSMAAHMDVISVCRRALEWDQANKTYRWDQAKCTKSIERLMRTHHQTKKSDTHVMV